MLEIKLATTPEEKEAVYRFRYTVYVEEMGRYQATADHVGRRLADPEDDHSWIFFAADDGEVVGSFRMTWGGDGFSQRQIDQYGIAPFLADIPAERMAVGERTMIKPSCAGNRPVHTDERGLHRLQRGRRRAGCIRGLSSRT